MKIIANGSTEAFEAPKDIKEDVVARNSSPVTDGNSPSTQGLPVDYFSIAKSRFADTVSCAVSELMERRGYSREMAVAVILKHIQHNDERPSDNEVFELMNKCGIGLKDAEKALIISRAVNRTCQSRNLTPPQAIEDLIIKLSISRLCSNLESGKLNTLVEPKHNAGIPETTDRGYRKETNKSLASSLSKDTCLVRKNSVKSHPKISKKNLSSPKPNCVKPIKQRKDELLNQKPVSDPSVPLALAKKVKLASEASSETSKIGKTGKRKRNPQHVAEDGLETPNKRGRGSSI